MGSLKFKLVFFGGIADDPEPKAAADKVAIVLRDMALDVRDVCRNLSVGEEVAKEYRVFIEGPPQKGESLAFPMAAEEGLGILSVQAYASGVEELRKPDQKSTALPKGFDSCILQRISEACQAISEDHNGFTIDVPAVNGTPAIRATFDARLRTAVDLKLALIEQEQRAEIRSVERPDNQVYGYSIQGILFEMSDPHYENPEGIISVQVDARDGLHWVCHLDRSIAPDNLKELWKTEVLITGTATFRARKPILQATTFRSLPGVADPVKAMKELINLCGNLSGEPVQDFMDRVRERE